MPNQILRIKGWNDHYENNRTRELKRMEWVPVPNKHDGDGFSTLMDHERGLAHLGAWLLILQVASKCEIRGTLSRTGAVPHTAASIARIGHADAAIIQEAMDRLVDEIGWLEVIENTQHVTAPQETAIIPQVAAVECGKSAASRERQCAPAERNGMERNGTEGGGAPAAAPPPQPPPLDDLDFEPVIIELIAVHPVGGSIPLARLAVREQFARYGAGDFQVFCERLRTAHVQQRAKWSRNQKLRVREFQYWLTDGDWRVSSEISIVPVPASPVKVCEICNGKTLVLDEQGYGLYCPGCGGADGGKILFEPAEAPSVAEGLRTWHRVENLQAVAL